MDDDEEKLRVSFSGNSTKYRLGELTPSKQVRFSQDSPSFCDPFAGIANSTRPPPRYAKREQGSPTKAGINKDCVKRRNLPFSTEDAIVMDIDVPPGRVCPLAAPAPTNKNPEIEIWDKIISHAIDSAEGIIDVK